MESSGRPANAAEAGAQPQLQSMSQSTVNDSSSPGCVAFVLTEVDLNLYVDGFALGVSCTESLLTEVLFYKVLLGIIGTYGLSTV